MALLLVTLLLPLTTLAQIVNYAQIPCAQTCPAFIAAQNLCIPPAVDAPSVACFCNSGYMAPLKQGLTTGVCDVTCSAPDMQIVLQYYQGLCAQAAAAVTTTAAAAAPAGATTAVTTKVSTKAGGAVTTVTVPKSTSTTTAAARAGNSLNAKPKPWINDHYGWVIMIIVLVLAAIIGTLLGVWFKRRHRRNQDMKNRSSTLATADAIQALRDPHPQQPSSMVSRQGIPGAIAGAAPLPTHQRYNSTGSMRGATSNSSLNPVGPHVLGAGVRAPNSSTSDMKGKARADEVGTQAPARRSSSKLQRRSSGATSPPPVQVPHSPISPILPPENYPKR